MNALGVFGIAAGVSGVYTAMRYDGAVKYTGPDADTPAGQIRSETEAPDERNHRYIYAASGIAAAAGGAGVLAPTLAGMTKNPDVPAALRAADSAVFHKSGAALLGIGVGLGVGLTVAKMTD